MTHVFLVLCIQWLLGYHPPATSIERSNTMQAERFSGWTGPVVHIPLHNFGQVTQIQNRVAKGGERKIPPGVAQATAIWDQTPPSPVEAVPILFAISILVALGAFRPWGACTVFFRRATRRLSDAWLNLNLRLAAFAGEPQIAWT
jgi:hypothetical protein